MINRFNSFQPYLISPQNNFRLPLDIIGGTLDMLQERSDKNKAMANEIPTIFSMPALEKDKPALRAKEQEYLSRIDKATANLNGDYSQIGNLLFDITRDIKKELRPTGKLGAIANEYGSYEEHKKALMEMYKKGEITSDALSEAINYSLNSYTGVGEIDPITGNYNKYNPLYAPSFDLSKVMESSIAKLKPTNTKTTDFNPIGRATIQKTSLDTEKLSTDRLEASIMSDLMQDENFKASVAFRAKIDGDGGKKFIARTIEAIKGKAEATAYTNTKEDKDLLHNFEADYNLKLQDLEIQRRKARAAEEANRLTQVANAPMVINDKVSAFGQLPAWDVKKEGDLYGNADGRYQGTPYSANGWMKGLGMIPVTTNKTPQQRDAVQVADKYIVSLAANLLEKGDKQIPFNLQKAYKYASSIKDPNQRRQAQEQVFWQAKDFLLNDPSTKGIYSPIMYSKVQEVYDNSKTAREISLSIPITEEKTMMQLGRALKTGKAYAITNNKITTTPATLPTIEKDKLYSGEQSIRLETTSGRTGYVFTDNNIQYFVDGLLPAQVMETVNKADELSMKMNDPNYRGYEKTINNKTENVIHEEGGITMVKRTNRSLKPLQEMTDRGLIEIAPGATYNVFIDKKGNERISDPSEPYFTPDYQRAIQTVLPSYTTPPKGSRASNMADNLYRTN